MDATYTQMFLIAGDDRHLLREGITIIGSADNDRYPCIRLQDKSVCPKHAAVKWSAATEDVQIMDLCSHSGTQVSSTSNPAPEEIPPLQWYKATHGNTIHCGSFKVQLENSRSRLRHPSISIFADEDSTDIVDCSLEEPPQIKSKSERKKQGHSNSLSSSINTINDKSITHESNSFLIPATQQMNVSNRSNSSNLHQATNSKIGGSDTIDDDDDDMFYIPETQEQQQQSITEEIIDPIKNTIGQGEKDDDFLQFDTLDDENTGDGMFNNPYVEQSQNLLHNMDESYQRDGAKPDQRKSIIPDRSVDSISFHGRIPTNDTDDNLSKIVWNETKVTDDLQQDRDGSVTPELNFDKPLAPTRNAILESVPVDEIRSNSVTPDLEFDRASPFQKELTADSRKLSLVKSEGNLANQREVSITPDLNFERLSGENDPEEAEISLNQEGAMDPYDLATQPILAEEKSVYHQPTQKILTEEHHKPLVSATESPYDLLTQKIPMQELKAAKSLRKVKVQLMDLKSTMLEVSLRANKCIDLNPFEMATQPLSVDNADVYDLQTQQSPPQDLNDTVPLIFKQPATISKVRPKLSSRGTEKSLECDQFAMPTQPLPVDKPNDDIYDQQTQLLPKFDTDDENDTMPLDIANHQPPPSSDAFDLQTQPLVAKDSHTCLGDDDPEMSKHFRPKINSTYRQSILAKHLSNQEKIEEAPNEDDNNISPSSNKENQDEAGNWDSAKREAVRQKAKSIRLQVSEGQPGNSQRSDEGLDEEYCLAATLPVDDASSKGTSNGSSSSTTSSTRRGRRTNRQQEQDSIFKVPDSSIASSTKNPLNAGMETPRVKKTFSDPSIDNDAFDFNTPDHPFLKAAKREKILAISDLITSRSSQSNSSGQRNKYIFGDSSDEDEDPTVSVFQKEDSKVRVMKYDRDESMKKEVEPSTFAVPEPRSTRGRKKDKNELPADNIDKHGKRGSKSKSEHSDKPEDKSTDYEPPLSKPTRKRKAVENSSNSKSVPTDKAKKSTKTNKQEHEMKAGPSPKLDEKSATLKRGRLKRGESNINETAIPIVGDERKKQRVKSDKSMPLSKADTSSESELSCASSTELSGGARKSSRVSKPRLMFTKMSPEPYKRMITRAGGLIVDIPELATVLVSDRVYRTCKFLCAIAKGIPIVGQSYLEVITEKRYFVDPWDHILQDNEMEMRFKFNLKKSLTLARESRLLEDYSIIVTPSTKPPPEELQLIVTNAGGRVIKFPSQQPNHADKLFAVSDQQDKNMWPKLRERYPKIPIISTEGLMLSIMQHYKKFRSYRLT